MLRNKNRDLTRKKWCQSEKTVFFFFFNQIIFDFSVKIDKENVQVFLMKQFYITCEVHERLNDYIYKTAMNEDVL